MKEQFVPYDTAKKLKELGFDEECLFAYDGRMPKHTLDFKIRNSELKLADK